MTTRVVSVSVSHLSRDCPHLQDLPDENCTDLWLADAAVRTLRSVAADKNKPFALFVGFVSNLAPLQPPVHLSAVWSARD